jgi:hypothetical protein
LKTLATQGTVVMVFQDLCILKCLQSKESFQRSPHCSTLQHSRILGMTRGHLGRILQDNHTAVWMGPQTLPQGYFTFWIHPMGHHCARLLSMRICERLGIQNSPTHNTGIEMCNSR